MDYTGFSYDQSNNDQFVLSEWFILGVFKTKPTQQKTANQTKPNQNRKKPHLVRIRLGHFLIKPHGLVWFAVCIFQTELNQTKPHYVTTQTSIIPHPIQNSNLVCLNLTIKNDFLLLTLRISISTFLNLSQQYCTFFSSSLPCTFRFFYSNISSLMFFLFYLLCYYFLFKLRFCRTFLLNPASLVFFFSSSLISHLICFFMFYYNVFDIILCYYLYLSFIPLLSNLVFCIFNETFLFKYDEF